MKLMSNKQIVTGMLIALFLERGAWGAIVDQAIPVGSNLIQAIGGNADVVSQEKIVTPMLVSPESVVSSTNGNVIGSNSARSSADKRKQANKDISQFSRYVNGVVDKKLSIFGLDFFDSEEQSLFRQTSGQVNDDYKIGPGDEVQIHGWGMVDIDLLAKVDRSGEIYLPRVGSVKVAGVRYGDLQAYLKSAVRRVFNNFQLAVSLSQARSVQVYVVGNVKNPGVYTMSAMDTLLNALFVSGGPSVTGSMRNIQLKRAGRIFTQFDMYDMLLAGEKNHDVTLNDGDVIFVPEVGGMVAIYGDVKRQAIYELKGVNNINEVFKWAGGVSSAAEGRIVSVEKNDGKTIKNIAEGLYPDIAASLNNSHAMPASIIRVFSPDAVPHVVLSQKEYVSFSGDVPGPGTYPIKSGESLREFIMRVGGVNNTAYIYSVSLYRDSVKKSQQAKLDEVIDRYERDIESTAAQRLSGSVDKDLSINIQSEINRQRKIVSMMREVRADGRIVLEMKDAAASINDLPNIPLRDGDSIIIPRKPDTVNVIGAVRQQSSFIYKSNKNTDDYVKQAGGVAKSGDPSESYIIRADGTVDSIRSGLFNFLLSKNVNPGDSIVVPEKIETGSWVQSIKEWTTILYQFGLGAAGLKVLKN